MVDPFAVTALTGIALRLAGRFDEAVPLLREAIALGAASRDLDQILLASRCAGALGDDVPCFEHCSRALAMARERGAVGALPRILERLSFYELRVGQYSSAHLHAAEGLRLAREMGQDPGFPLCELAFVAAIRGREEKCRVFAAEAVGRASERRSGLLASMATWAIGLLDLGLGRPERALAVLESALAGKGVLTHPIISLFLTPDYIEAAVRAGELDDAQQALAAFDQWASASGQAWALALVSHCLGLVSAGEEAEQHLARALDLYPPTRPFERARTALALGEVLRRRRRRREAREQLRSALEAFERCEAGPWEARARAELRASGETARKRDPSTIDQLTPQELQIARFVAEGLSNKEVAAQLFLSPRTIDSHLRKVFAKLGLTSRTQLARIQLGDEAPQDTVGAAPAPA